MQHEWQSLVDHVAETNGVSAAAVFSRDGLLHASSTGLNPIDADHLAAVSTGLYALASEVAGRCAPGGKARQTVVEVHSEGEAPRFLLVGSVGERSCLAVITSADADLGHVAYRVAGLAEASRA